MHGLGFVHINEWSWIAGRQFACLILRNGKLTIVGMRADFGMDTESAFRHCVATESGVKYEDIVVQHQRTDADTFQFWVPGGSMGISQTTPQLIVAARELKRKIIDYAVRSRANPMMGWAARCRMTAPAGGSRFPERSRRTGCQRRICFREGKPDNQKNGEGSCISILGRRSGDHSSRLSRA